MPPQLNRTLQQIASAWTQITQKWMWPWQHPRWQADANFRRIVSAGIGALVVMTLALSCVGGERLFVFLVFGAGRTNAGATAVGIGFNPTFPVPPATPYTVGKLAPPQAVAAVPYGRPSPTPAASPTVTPIPTVACPPPGTTAGMSGNTVRDGVNPDPLQAGCSAHLLIAASRQTFAPVSLTLVFGSLTQAGCTLNLTGQTDAQGNATVPFTVPANCFRGAILTTGTLTVGNDTTGNVTFHAEG